MLHDITWDAQGDTALISFLPLKNILFAKMLTFALLLSANALLINSSPTNSFKDPESNTRPDPDNLDGKRLYLPSEYELEEFGKDPCANFFIFDDSWLDHE